MSVEARAAASPVIEDAAIALLAAKLSAGDVVALYSAKGSEVETTRIDGYARARGLVVAYPRVIADSRQLRFHRVALDALAPSRFGLREPSADAAAIELADIAAFIVPGLGFDRMGGRIGWGRGHYDATFAASASSALRVGLAYACQVIDHVVREPHDVALHYVITEVATHAVA